MKLFYLCALLFLAGAVSSSAVDYNRESIKAWGAEAKLDIPDWVIDLIERLPGSIQEIIDRLPEIIAQIPGIMEQIPAIIEAIIDKIPEIIPIILDKIPEIIAQIPAAIEVVKEVILRIIERIPDIIAALPEIREKILEILEKLDNLDVPEWLPSLPDGLPLPSFNEPVPGTPTSVSEFPSIVQVEAGTGSIWLQGCVASMITNFHALSSARCVTGFGYDIRNRRIRAGASNRLEGGVIEYLSNVLVHPNFAANLQLFDNDISILRMSNPLALGGNIQQVAIVPQDFRLPAGLSVEVASWGSTAQGGVVIDSNLHKILLEVIDLPICRENYETRIPVFSITDNMVCLGRPETGGRNGDIRDMGAPGYFQGSLVSIQSIAVIGNQEFEIVATNVGSHTNWIVANAV